MFDAMRRLALVSFVLLVLSAGSAYAFLPSHPVSASVEKQIAKRAGLESYSPARMMTGWHYTSWQYVPGELRIWFTNRSKWLVKFDVTPLLAKTCSVGKQQTFQLSGNKVYWSESSDPTLDYSQQAWRCVKSPSGRWMRIVVSSPVSAKKLAGVGLGGVAASGRLVK
jgi:hypothetical protein